MTNARNLTSPKSQEVNIEGKSSKNPTSLKPTQTKKARLIALLNARNGARTPTICKSLGWQKHTVRAALSGLRKEGHVIVTSKSARDGVTVYRIGTNPEKTA